MWDFEVGRGLSLMRQTLPFIILRIVVYFGIAVAMLIAAATGAGLGWGFGGLGGEDMQATATFWGGIIGFLAVGAVVYWVREYILYIVKAGHIAVLVELLDGKTLPQGRPQIEHARAIVTERFSQTTVLFAVDQLIKGVLAAITGLVRGIFTVLPIPGIRQLVEIVHAFLRVAVGYIDEVILAYLIRTRAANPWEGAHTALILYGQNYKAMLRNAAWLTLFVYLISVLVFLLMLAPAAGIAYLIPGEWSSVAFVLAILFAWSVKAALLEPFAIACLMQAYFRTIEGQVPDPEWEARLAQMSDKFRTLKERALSSGAGPAGAPKASVLSPAP